MTKTISVLTTPIVLLLASGLLQAQEWRREPTIGTEALVCGFTPDPLPFVLTAGGGSDPVNVQTLGLYDGASGAPCTQAYIARSPDFRFTISEPDSFELLRFYVVTDNGADATLLVGQPDSSWRCNDDSFGTLMPSIDMTDLVAGQYDVWIGTYDASSNNPATFYITEQVANQPAAHLGSMVSTTTSHSSQSLGLNMVAATGESPPVSLSPGFAADPYTTSGSSGGNVSINLHTSINGGSCAGFVHNNPDHIFNASGRFNYLRVDVVTPGGGDTTMIIQDPAGNFLCSDDDGEFPNPRIAGNFSAGTHRIWVGSYSSGQVHSYNISFTERHP